VLYGGRSIAAVYLVKTTMDGPIHEPLPPLFRMAESRPAAATALPSPFADTRTAAGHAAASSSAERQKQILRLLAVRGPMAPHEVAGAMGLPPNRISGRFGANDPGSLQYQGWIEATEARRLTSSGRAAVVWRITPAGRDELARRESEQRDKAAASEAA
jgi:hypothetical protein